MAPPPTHSWSTWPSTTPGATPPPQRSGARTSPTRSTSADPRWTQPQAEAPLTARSKVNQSAPTKRWAVLPRQTSTPGGTGRPSGIVNRADRQRPDIVIPAHEADGAACNENAIGSTHVCRWLDGDPVGQDLDEREIGVWTGPDSVVRDVEGIAVGNLVPVGLLVPPNLLECRRPAHAECAAGGPSARVAPGSRS